MKKYSAFLLLATLFACSSKPESNGDRLLLNEIGNEYVRLGLSIGAYDSDFVDAYYGPDSLKPVQAKTDTFPKNTFLNQAATLKERLRTLAANTSNDTIASRADWLTHQLTAFERRIRIFSKEVAPFDTESQELFDAKAPVYNEKHFQQLVQKLDSVLPGKGSIQARYQQLANRFLIPKNRIDTVFRLAIDEARRRTLSHYKLPENETFDLEYVTDKPWSGYNWYKGNYHSLIQINISQPIFIERAIDLACHEGYPGHHVYNVLLEKNLFRDKGWTEIALYPLFSPQSLIAEGSANFGISIAFPGNEQEEFCQKVLLPAAGLDTNGTDMYFKALSLKSMLGYARNEVARGLLSNAMNEPEAERWLRDYCLLTEKGASDYVRFIKKYRSYVINYNYGQDLVRKYIESRGGTVNAPGRRASERRAPERRWELFGALLSSPTRAGKLVENK
jgi:hypothetical protein